MKKQIIFLVAILVLTNVQSLKSQDNFGTLITARLVNSLNSKVDSLSSIANLIVAYDVTVDGEVIIKKGTIIDNNINVTKPKGVGKPAMINIDAIATTDVNGKTIPLNGTFSVEGKSNRGKALGVGLGVGLGTFLFPMIAYIAKKGEHVKVKANTLISDFFIDK